MSAEGSFEDVKRTRQRIGEPIQDTIKTCFSVKMQNVIALSRSHLLGLYDQAKIYFFFRNSHKEIFLRREAQRSQGSPQGVISFHTSLKTLLLTIESCTVFVGKASIDAGKIFLCDCPRFLTAHNAIGKTFLMFALRFRMRKSSKDSSLPFFNIHFQSLPISYEPSSQTPAASCRFVLCKYNYTQSLCAKNKTRQTTKTVFFRTDTRSSRSTNGFSKGFGHVHTRRMATNRPDRFSHNHRQIAKWSYVLYPRQ